MQIRNKCDWEHQEACFVTLLKLLGHIVETPTEPKFRRLKLTNATLKAKVFDVPGAQDFLRTAGFVEEGEFLVVPLGSQAQASVAAALKLLHHHADEAKMDQMRRERDAKIARAKEEENKVTKWNLTSHMTGEEVED